MKKLLCFMCAVVAYAQPTPIPKATRMTAWEVYESPNSRIIRQQATVGTIDIFNTAGASRLSWSSAGGLSTTVGIMEGRTGAAGSETTVWRGDSTGLFTNQAIRVIDGVGDRVKLEAASSSFYNSGLAQRVFISSAGGTSSTVGIVAGYTGAAGSETTVWRADSTGVFTNQSLRVIDTLGDRVKLEAASSSFYNSNLAQRVFISSAGGASSTVGIVAGYTGAAGAETIAWQANSAGFSTVASLRVLTSGGNYAGFKVNPALATNLEWMLPTADAVGCLQSDGAGTLSISSCGGGGGSFVTTNTAQTITSAADKDIESIFTWVSGGVDRIQIAPAQQSFWNNTGASRVFISSSSGLSTSAGIVRILTGSAGIESIVADMTSTGINVNTSAGGTYRVNGSSGTTASCGSGQYPSFLSVTAGIVLSFGCSAAGSGDMLLGTSQTVTALKTFQMSFGGDAIRVNNTSSQMRGRWDDTQLVVGDQAAGSGRGVALVGASGVIVYNTSGVAVIQGGTTGNMSAVSYTANGSPGLSGACASGLRPVFTGGIATGCI